MSIWLVMDRAFTDLQGVSPLGYGEWTNLLVDSGLKDIQSRTYKYTYLRDTIRNLRLHALIIVGIKYLTNSKMRKWINRQEALFCEYSDYWGHGLCVGGKQGFKEILASKI